MCALDLEGTCTITWAYLLPIVTTFDTAVRVELPIHSSVRALRVLAPASQLNSHKSASITDGLPNKPCDRDFENWLLPKCLFVLYFSYFSRKHCEGFFRAELLVNLRRVACTESPAWRYQELLVNLRRVACAESPAWRCQHGDTRAELLAQSSLHRATSMEILAQRHQHGVTSIELLAQSQVQRAKRIEPSAQSEVQRARCKEPSAQN